METEKNIKKRGRPATGRKRDKKITVRLTADELAQVQAYQNEKKITVADILINEVYKLQE